LLAGLSETFSPSGKIPAYLNGGHYGPTLIRFALYQYYHCHVTQPLLLEQLHELDIDISTGQLNNFLIENKERFHQEKDQVWLLYEGLKNYKQNPKRKEKKRLEKMFVKIFSSKTASATLNTVLKRIYKNKSELLLVLDRPDIPLHNNGAESAIREYVKKRKISGSTRSETGRQCRDTFTSLKKTCRKLGLSFLLMFYKLAFFYLY
jgi:hypothetical protein